MLGLFLGTANVLRSGGPVGEFALFYQFEEYNKLKSCSSAGLLLGYSTIGTICYCVMVCFLPENAKRNP